MNDCEHGVRELSCPHCELRKAQDDSVALHTEIVCLKAENIALRQEIQRLHKWLITLGNTRQAPTT